MVTGSAAEHADTAAEAVRALNHATLPGAGGLTEPADVYAVVGQLATLAARLPQALDQLGAFLDSRLAADRVAVVDGPLRGDAATAVAGARGDLTAATCAAHALHAALEAAHNVLADLADTSPDTGPV